MTTHKIHDSLPQGFNQANDLQVEHYLITGFVPGARRVAAFWTPQDEGGELQARLAQRLGFTGSYIDLGYVLAPPRMLKDIKSVLARDAAAERWGPGALDHASDWYIREYNKGWRGATQEHCPAWEDGTSSHAFDDGYLDRAAGRAKWHLTYCLNHDTCGEN